MIPLNRSQCHGLDLDRHLVLDAGAGTGKTTVMSVRYIEHILSEDQRASRLLPMGPREARTGQGALRIPRNQQQELEEWGGLLPPECVAITFTVKAAAELKERIRSILASLASTLDGDPGSRFDPRLRKPGFVEQLMSLLDSAPIGTIDSFLSRLVAPHLSLVSDVHASETMSEEDGPMLNDSAISLFWSLQSEFDALDAGMTGDILSMLQSRDRLALMMGGRRTAAIVINGLIGQTLFVEEAENAWFSHTGEDGLQTSMEMLRSLTPEADALIPAIRAAANEWMDVIRGQSSALKLAEGLAEDSRIRAIDELLNIPVDAGNWSALLWLHHLLMSMTSMAQYLSPSPIVLPKGQPPKGAAAGGWGAGIQAWGKVSKSSRDAAKSAAENAAETIRNILSTPQGLRLRVVARSAALFDSSALINPAPIGSKMNP
ncbi:MAG: UvrD-helicase domain-containing protein, partial [Euryarchaeota archaeon]|nr:UvrD-helicase domain-containing protein [Euryarchaeota archaeon]